MRTKPCLRTSTLCLLIVAAVTTASSSRADNEDARTTPKEVLRAADNKALEALQNIGEEYKDFKVADAAAANVRPQSVSLRVVGGLRYFTKYSGGRVGAVKLSEQEAQKSKAFLEQYVTQTLQTKTNVNSPWQLLVKCNQSTGAKMGGGAIWEGIPSVESDEVLNGGGVWLGFGGSVQPLVTGSLFLVNTKDRLLVSQKDIYAAGSDMDSALRGFAEEIAREVKVAGIVPQEELLDVKRLSATTAVARPQKDVLTAQASDGVVDFKRIAEIKAKAEKGDADAQYDLGTRYYKGDGVPQDYTEASKWFDKAAAQRRANAVQLSSSAAHKEDATTRAKELRDTGMLVETGTATTLANAMAIADHASEEIVTSISNVPALEQKLLQRAMTNTAEHPYKIADIRPVGNSRLAGKICIAGKGKLPVAENLKDRLGEGVVLEYIYPVARGAEVNVQKGKAGMLLRNESVDFSPIYSVGAVWEQIPKLIENDKVDPLNGVAFCPGIRLGALYEGDGNLVFDYVKAGNVIIHFPGGTVGSIHRFIGDIQVGGYTFSGENDCLNPLTFLLKNDGYVYLRGRGTLILPTGEKVRLPGKEESTSQTSDLGRVSTEKPRVTVGMSQDQVTEAMGKPDFTERMFIGRETTETWLYQEKLPAQPRTVLEFDGNGVLKKIEANKK